MFALACVLLPLSNKIAGPVDKTNSSIPVNITGPANESTPDYFWSRSDSSILVNISGSANGSVPAYLWSGSGMEGGLNETVQANATDYCGNEAGEESLVNENSIKRIPWYVWIILSLLLGFMVVSR